MKFTEFYAEQFRSLHSGQHWLDVNFMSRIGNLTAQQALTSLNNTNSIWTILNHVSFWRNNLTMKLRGEDTRGYTDFEPINDISESAWKDTLKKFNTSMEKLTEAIEEMDDEKLSESYKNVATYNELIAGTLQHDAYHLGQIVMLVKNL